VFDPAALQWILIAAGILTGGVFMLAFRFALREGRRGRSAEALPPVRVVGGLARSAMVRGRVHGRVQHAFWLAQAGMVAVGITAVFFMFLCLAAMVAVALVGG
jgi:hypothetical protein